MALKLSVFNKSKLINSFGIYTIFSIVDKVMPFLFLPVIARKISKEDMGNYVLYQSIYAIVFFLLSLNSDSAVLLNYFKLSRFKFKIYLSNGLMIFTIWYIILAGILYALAPSISRWVDFPAFWLQILLLVVVFQYVQTLKLNMYQVNKKPVAYGIFRISNTCLTYALALYFIFFMNLSWKGFVIAQLISSLIFSIISLVLMYRERLFHFLIYKPFIKDNLKVGLPLTLHNMNAWLGNFATRLVINAVIGKAATGSYGVGATFGIIVTVLQESFNRAYVPFLFEKLKNFNADTGVKLVKYTYAYYILILTISLAIGVSGFYMVGWLFGKEYDNTRYLILPVVFANALNGMYKMHINYLFYQKRTLAIAKVTFIGGIINVALCYVFLNIYGFIGAAYALLLTQLLTYIVAFYLGNKAVPLPWLHVVNTIQWSKLYQKALKRQ